ncbi:hypothetical protein OBBRIDRAFT_779980 [Obba rivulosa]|uniref:Reverse transcriptase domain-containing protein n=1 Tax=Obba rivulosa TaxID=1052685 RepID=A0A8E2DIY6_9APHY|nr:hypothetical protein OBBRIDRAFT_779980 [Obba rivulosa]
MGAAGPLIDWLRMLYDRMVYTVRLDGAYSGAFKSFLGILAGDSASPILWLLFMSDLHIPAHPDDVVLGGTRVSRVEQADDLAAWCMSTAGTQLKLDAIYRWCGTKGFVLANAVKSVAMAFGPLPERPPQLYLGSVPLKWVSSTTFLGTLFCSTERNIFAPHYSAKAEKAQRVASSTLAVEALIGDIPPREGRLLHMSRVDPHLTYACDVVLDIDAPLLAKLEAVQHYHLRRVLGLSSRCTTAVLFTETGLQPLRYRRVLLALGYLSYICSLQRLAPYVGAAFRESVALARAGHPSWVSDLSHVLAAVTVHFDFHRPITSEYVACLTNDVLASLDTDLARELMTSPKLHLLRHRGKVAEFRPYLNVLVPQHRVALTRMLVSDHPLAMERLRWAERYRSPVPRHLRICRLCEDGLEDPVHAMFVCTGDDDLSAIRASFWSKVDAELPGLRRRARDAEHMLALLMDEQSVHALVAKLAFETLGVFARVPMLVLAAPAR